MSPFFDDFRFVFSYFELKLIDSDFALFRRKANGIAQKMLTKRSRKALKKLPKHSQNAHRSLLKRLLDCSKRTREMLTKRSKKGNKKRAVFYQNSPFYISDFAFLMRIFIEKQPFFGKLGWKLICKFIHYCRKASDFEGEKNGSFALLFAFIRTKK